MALGKRERKCFVLIILLLFGMIVAIAYQQELALLLSAVVCLLVVVSLGQGLPEFVAYTATVASSRHGTRSQGQ